MQITTGKVVAGKVVVEGAALEEGTIVTILAPEAARGFHVGPEDEVVLLAALDEVSRGEVVEPEELLRKLGRRG